MGQGGPRSPDQADKKVGAGRFRPGPPARGRGLRTMSGYKGPKNQRPERGRSKQETNRQKPCHHRVIERVGGARGGAENSGPPHQPADQTGEGA